MKTTQLTDQEKYMKEALRQAKKAYALGEVPIGCVIVHEGKLSGEDITVGIRIKIHWRMRKLPQSIRQAGN